MGDPAPWLCEEVRQIDCKEYNVKSRRKRRNENRFRFQYSLENNIRKIGGRGKNNNVRRKLLHPVWYNPLLRWWPVPEKADIKWIPPLPASKSSCKLLIFPSSFSASISDVDAHLLPVRIRGQEEGAFPASPSLLVPLSLSWLGSQNWLTIAGSIWSVNKRFLVFKNKDQVLEMRAWKQCVNDRKSIKGGHDMEVVSQTGQERFWGTDNTACSLKLASGGEWMRRESRWTGIQHPYWYPAFTRICTLSWERTKFLKQARALLHSSHPQRCLANLFLFKDLPIQISSNWWAVI